MASKPETESYFAPPAGTAPVEATEAPTWGEDAESIAREAGLGSYQGTATETQEREDAIIRALEQTDLELRALRRRVNIFAVVGFVMILMEGLRGP